MRIWIAVAGLMVLSACNNKPPVEPPVNTQINENLDVTGDGRAESITLFLKAANPHSGMQWMLTIESNGATIFDRDGDDSDYDTVFNDRDAMPGCSDYITCKRAYYGESLLGNLIDHNWDPEDLLDMQQGGKLPPTVYRNLLQCCSIDGPKAAEIVEDLERRIRERKAIVISPPISPTESGPRMVFSQAAGQFIDIDAQ